MGIRASVQDCMKGLCSSVSCLWWWPTTYGWGVVWSSTSMQGEMPSLNSGNSPASAHCDSEHPQSIAPVMSQTRWYSWGTEMHSTNLFLITDQHILLFCHWTYCFSSLVRVTALWSFSQTSRCLPLNRAGWAHLHTLCWDSMLYCSPLAVPPQESGTWKLTTHHSSHCVKKK